MDQRNINSVVLPEKRKKRLPRKRYEEDEMWRVQEVSLDITDGIERSISN